MAKRRRSNIPVQCDECGKVISRKADLPRHLKTHAPNKEQLMHFCPYRDDGCPYKTLQASNLMTHLNVHSGERPFKCTHEGCAFATSDPGSLTRHRKECHGYVPKGSSGDHSPITRRKAARQRRRHTPYISSTSSSGSSSSGPDTPSPPPSLADGQPRGCSKENNLITEPARVDDGSFVFNTLVEDALPLNSGMFTALDKPAAVSSRLPATKQGGINATIATIQPVCEMDVSEEVFNNFLSKFGDWPLPYSLPTSVTSYGVDNVLVSTSTALPSYWDQYIVDNALIPAPASFLSAEVQGSVNNASYNYYGYGTEVAPMDPQSSRPNLVATPGMGAYPRTVYHQDVDPRYLYTTCTGSGGFQGLYVN